MKTCSRCKITKEPICFSISQGYLKSQCKICRVDLNRIRIAKRKVADPLYWQKVGIKDRPRLDRLRKCPEYQKKRRFYVAKYRQKNKDAVIDSDREKIKKITDWYVKNTLRNQGFKPEEITQEIIEQKRLIIKIHRQIHEKQPKIK